MHILYNFVVPGGLFILTLVFGFWLSHAGKPYNGFLFNVHKLIALGFVVLAGIQFSKMLQAPDWLLVALLVGSALCVIALFVSGALMSARKLDYQTIHTAHNLALAFLVASLALTFYFLNRI
jgi:hypothetical protein